MEKAILIYSGGMDSVCCASYLKSKYDIYGITFSYGQKASREIISAKNFAKKLKFKKHKIVDISFMKQLYGNSNVLTSSKTKIPNKFDYSIVVPIRNAVFLSIGTAWAFTLQANLVAYGAHTGDKNYPDCRPKFAKNLESAFNQGEADGINKGIRKSIKIWSPYTQKMSKSDLIKKGYNLLGETIFQTWSCYLNKDFHCGNCESCNNRKIAFKKLGINDKTKYL